METRISKVSLLWVIIMVGFAMHMLADMLPAFWGANIAMPDATIGNLSVHLLAPFAKTKRLVP